MTPTRYMIIAGEASGDALAAELVLALKSSAATQKLVYPPEFFGAGGQKMAAAGVKLAFDMTEHSVIGLQEAIRSYFTFKRIMDELLRLAIDRAPDVIVCVDFSGFNRRFAHAVREHVRRHRSRFYSWNPKIVQYVSPQVWASRPGRAYAMARDLDLLLCTFPFEPAWYAKRVPKLKVEFVGNPIIDRYSNLERKPPSPVPQSPLVLLLPGSRNAELRRHIPVLIETAKRLKARRPVRFRAILPNERLAEMAKPLFADLPELEMHTGELAESLAEAALAISKTGTVTLECAYFRVPTVALYKTSWFTYLIGRQIVTIKYAAMPNLLADEAVFPEFIQSDANVENLSREAIDLLENAQRRVAVQAKLDAIIASLGKGGAAKNAAEAIARFEV